MVGTSLRPNQIKAISLSEKYGKIIARELEGVVEDYRNGSTILEIIEKYHIGERYGLTTERCCVTSVSNALGILLSKEERRALESEHHSKKAIELYEEGVGLFSLSEERKQEVRSKAGKIGGQVSYSKGKGFFSLSEEEKRRNSSKGGKAAAVSQGHVPFEDDEKELVLELSQLLEYQKGSRIRTTKIAELLNQRLHNGENIRNERSITNLLFKLRKAGKLEKAVVGQ
jgi:hypothetical protein